MASTLANGNMDVGNEDMNSAKMPKKARKSMPNMLLIQRNLSKSQMDNSKGNCKLSMEKDVEEQIFNGRLPPYTPTLPNTPFPSVDGHSDTFFSCESCGDKFLLESSLKMHTERRSVKIKLCCLGVAEPKVFYNRCKLLNSLRLNKNALNGRLSLQPLEQDMLRLSHQQSTSVDQVVTKASSSNQEFTNDSRARTESRSASFDSDVSIHKVNSSSESRKHRKNKEPPLTNNEDVQITPLVNMISAPKIPEPSVTKDPVAKSANNNKISKTTTADALPIVTNKCPACNVKILAGSNLKQHFSGATDVPSSSNSSDFKCRKCKIPLPTSCSLKIHERIHHANFKERTSHACPECGIEYSNRDLLMEHIHSDCMHAYFSECYKCPSCSKMFATAISLEVHIIKVHVKKVHKCSTCNIACYSPQALEKHCIDAHNELVGRPIVYQLCQLCPGRLITQSYLLFHVHEHAEDSQNAFLRYVCEPCGVFVERREDFIDHKEVCESTESKFTKTDSEADEQNCRESITASFHNKTSVESSPSISAVNQSHSNQKLKAIKNKSNTSTKEISSNNSAVKANNRPCHKCGKSMQLYKHKMFACFSCNKSLNKGKSLKKSNLAKNVITKLSNGASSEESNLNFLEEHDKTNGSQSEIFKCPICYECVTEDFDSVQEHCEKIHKNICLDFQWSPDTYKEDLQKLSHTTKSINRDSKFTCTICELRTDEEEEFREHVVTHRPADSPAYQCMECGMCYVVKPSLEKHLLLSHKIRGVDNYLQESGQDPDEEQARGEPLKENQCKVCYREFEAAPELNTHLRTHGMAFLLNKCGPDLLKSP